MSAIFERKLNALYGGLVELGFDREHFEAARIAFDQNPNRSLVTFMTNLAWGGHISASDSFQVGELVREEFQIDTLETLQDQRIPKAVARIALTYLGF